MPPLRVLNPPIFQPQTLPELSMAQFSSSASHPLKIWQIAETYPPEYGGGAAMYVRDVCYYLAQRGHEVRVLCAENRDAEAYSIRTDWDGPVQMDRLNLPYFRGKDPDGW